MKVCMITGSFPGRVCGVGDYTANLVESLTKNGIETVVITSKEDIICKESKRFGFFVHPVMKNWNWRDAFSLGAIIMKQKPDIVHIQYQTSIYKNRMMILFLPFILRILMNGVKTVTTFHDLNGPKVFPGARLLKLPEFIMLFVYYFSHQLIVCQRDEKRLLQLPFLRKKTKSIPVGSNIQLHLPTDSQKKAFKREIGINHDTPVLSTFGLVSASRDYENMFLAMKKILQNNATSTSRFILIGGEDKASIYEDSGLKKLTQRVEELGLSENVFFTGYCDNERLGMFLAISDVFLLPFTKPDYVTSSCSFPLLLSYQKPVMLVSYADMPEWLEDGKNVVLIPARSPNQWADRIIELIEQKKTCNTIGKNAADLFEKEFSWEHISKEVRSLYHLLLPGRNHNEIDTNESK